MAKAVQPIPLMRPDAALLLLHAQGLLDDPDQPASAPDIAALIDRLGFVQVDSINIVERAHHHILWSRARSYTPATLDALQRSAAIFEHWTHDASILPAHHFPHWRHRFARVAWEPWLKRRIGRGHQAVTQKIIDHIHAHGPIQARDLSAQTPRKKGDPGNWWNWSPTKAALEYLWRRGELAIAHRTRFEKVYDLTQRVLPRVHALPAPPREEHIDWAARSALDRLGVATPRELADFYKLLTNTEAAHWIRPRHDLVPVSFEGEPPSPPARTPYAPADIEARLAAARAAHAARRDSGDTLRILSPFDPVIRDRARLARLFGFDYRFEAFTPAAKRTYGYYVLPVLDLGSAEPRFIARVNPRMDRSGSTLVVQDIHWEPGVKPTAPRVKALKAALTRYAAFCGARTLTMPA